MTKSNWVLLIEDDIDLSETLTECLTQAGYRVIVSNRPFEAISKLRNQKFDCVVSDFKLQQETAAQVIDFIRLSGSVNEKVPILVMSGALDKEAVLSMKHQVNMILVKPVSQEKLIESVKNLIG